MGSYSVIILKLDFLTLLYIFINRAYRSMGMKLFTLKRKYVYQSQEIILVDSICDQVNTNIDALNYL